MLSSRYRFETELMKAILYFSRAARRKAPTPYSIVSVDLMCWGSWPVSWTHLSIPSGPTHSVRLCQALIVGTRNLSLSPVLNRLSIPGRWNKASVNSCKEGTRLRTSLAMMASRVMPGGRSGRSRFLRASDTDSGLNPDIQLS